MGTNFYWITQPDLSTQITFETPAGVHTTTFEVDEDDPRVHIGKRSAAGRYCWDCRVTLCKGGEKGIHFDRSEWFTRCPKCSKKPAEETLTSSSSGIELGFAKPKTERPAGVRSVSSFTWAQDPELVKQVCGKYKAVDIIRDEYLTQYTGAGFLEMLEANCPIRFTDLIGKVFC